MLLDFKIKNFKSYFEEAELSMLPSLKRDLSDTFIVSKKPEYNILPNAVIYGANASGKSNFLLALKMLKEIVLSGSIDWRNDEKSVKHELQLCFFIHDLKKYNSPMKFSITFLEKNLEYQYDLSLSSNNEVLEEQLLINEVLIFTRKESVVSISRNKKVYKYYDDQMRKNFEDHAKMYEEMMKINISNKSVFTNWFSSINSKITNNFTDWFKNKLLCFENIENLNIMIKRNNENENGKSQYINKAISILLKNAEFGPQSIIFDSTENNDDKSELILKPLSIYNLEDIPLRIDSKFMESSGTLKLIKFFDPFINCLKSGAVLAIDEFDSSINPELVVGIIRVFENPKINVNGAQLIFTTHNPIYLNSNIFRRDEILFVEKDHKSFESKIYSLEDFNVRNDEVYYKNYLSGKYIDIPEINFESVVKKVLDLSGGLNEKGKKARKD